VGLTRRYEMGDTSVDALRGVDLEIQAHDFVSVIGPNGGGKTTLLKLILGLLVPAEGTVSVLGGAPARARPRLGYMPQQRSHDPRFPATVLDVVLLGRLGRSPALGPHRRADRAQARAALGEVGLVDRAAAPLTALSGGQRQRVLVARALCSEPEILLLDEPTANVDVSARAGFYELLERLTERLTVVMVSHDLSLISERIQTCVCVGHGAAVRHPTRELTGELLDELWGGDMRLVRHDHRCAEDGHQQGWP